MCQLNGQGRMIHQSLDVRSLNLTGHETKHKVWIIEFQKLLKVQRH